MAIKYPDRIESNNPQAYGIIKATEIAGQRQVKQLSDLYKLSDAILSESKTGEDAEGQIWIVGKDQYQLISWQNRNNASGWQKVIPFDEKMFDRFYNLDGNMINALTGYTKATELLSLLENDSLLNALGKLEYKADLTYDLVNSVYEGVHTIEELREMLKVLEGIQNSSEILNSYLSNYLPLTGGTMSGNLDMNKNALKTAGFEVVTALPTTNLFAGRKVIMNGIEYTYNGNLWTSQLDPLQKYADVVDKISTPLTTLNAKSYELQLDNDAISQIPQLLANNSTSLTDHVLQSSEYIYERMDKGTTNWVETTNRALYLGDKLRFTAWKDWETNVRGLSLKYPGSVNYIKLSINGRRFKMKVTIEYLTYTNTLGDADVDNIANYTWWKVYEKEFPHQKTTWIFPLQRLIYPNSIAGNINGNWYIHNVRITIESITAGTTGSTKFTPYVSIYTSNQINPTTVPININYDAKIKPTQNTTTYKTNSWILQYLTQGVNWLRDNKVETNSDATLGNVTATKFTKSGGTSSQFLKADGSLDSNTYATLDSTGKVEKSILADDLGGREETREEQFTFQPTANDESVKDGLAIVKSIKGNTVVWRSFTPMLNNNITLIPASNYTEVKSDGKIKMVFNNTEDVEFSRFYFTVSAKPVVVGKRYMAIFNFNGTKNIETVSNLYFAYRTHNSSIPKDIVNNAGVYRLIFQPVSSVNNMYLVGTDKVKIKSGGVFSVSLSIIDLDALYEGNIPSIAEFERLYPNTFYENNDGSLLNLKADSIKSVGFNQWDEQWEIGKIDYDGNTDTDTTYKDSICSKNYIKVLPDTDYFFNANGYVGYYACFDKNYKNIFPNTVYLSPLQNIKHIPTNCHYIKFYVNGITVYNNDICINLSHSGYRNGEYEHYKESIVNLPIKKYFPDGMKSAGEVRDEIIWDEGLKKYKIIQRVGSVDMGTLDWSFCDSSETYSPFFFVKNSVIKSYANIITAKYYFSNNSNDILVRDKIISTVPYVRNTNIIIRDNDYAYDANGLESFKQSLQGQILYYKLETPIETIIDDYDLIDYEVSDFGTEEILSDEPTTPIIAELQYGFNAVDEIRNHRFEIKRLNKKIDELTALVESLLTTQDVNYEEID